MQAAKDGSSTAMESLFARYLPQVHGIVAARMGRRLRAFVELEDMVQESMRLAIAGLDRFEHRTEGAFRHWLAKCVENAIRKEARLRVASKRGPGRVQRVADLTATRLAESLFPDGGPGVSKAARDREEEDRIEAAMLGLSPRYREVIALRVHGDPATRTRPSGSSANPMDSGGTSLSGYPLEGPAADIAERNRRLCGRCVPVVSDNRADTTALLSASSSSPSGRA